MWEKFITSKMVKDLLISLIFLVGLHIVIMVKAQSLFSTYIATPEAPATGGGILGRSNALGCGRVCGQNTNCKGYFVADDSPDSCVVFTDGSNGTGTTGIGTFYWKVPAAESPRTCAEMAIQLGTDLPYGQYQIDPDDAGGLDPITVTCNTSSDGTTWTYTDHDRLSTDTVHGSNHDWEVEYGYKHIITYNHSVTQLKALATLSNDCRMNVHIRCYEVVFEALDGRLFAGWVAYDGTVFHMTQGGDVCPLLTATTRKCNCNNDVNVWHTDTGNITDKANFPIKALAFGDMGPGGGETLEITLGQMECAGLAECGSPPEITFATKTVEGHAVGQVVYYYCFPGLVFGDGLNWTMITCMAGGTWGTPMFTKCNL